MKKTILSLILCLATVGLFAAIQTGPPTSSSSSGSTNVINVITNDTRVITLTNTGNTFSGDGSGMFNTEAAILNKRLNSFYSLSYTNIGGIDTLYYNVPVSAQTNSGDYLIGIMSPTPVSSSCGGFFFPMFGTNKTYNNYTGTAWSILPSGQTNYLYDQKAMAINGNGANNTLDINGGTVGLFIDPHWPFYIGGFSPSSGEADWLYQDQTNWTVHFPTLKSGSNIDPRTGGIGNWDSLTIDERQGNVTASNLIVNNQILVKNSGADVATNYAQVTILSTASGWGPNFVLNATASSGGRSYGLNSTGVSDPAGAGLMSVYDYNLGDYVLYLGGTSHNLAIPRGSITTLSVTATNTLTASNFVQSANATNGNILFMGASGSIYNSNAVPTAALGTGTANSTKYLRGDKTWQITPVTVTVTADSTGFHQDGSSANFASGSVSAQVGDLANQPAYTVFGNSTGVSSTPTFNTVPVSLGHSTLRTNLFAIAATGWTNTNSFNCVAMVSATAATVTYSDGTNTIRTFTGITQELQLPMHPSYKFTAASGLAGNAIAQ